MKSIIKAGKKVSKIGKVLSPTKFPKKRVIIISKKGYNDRKNVDKNLNNNI